MKVFIVEASDWDSMSIIGVYASRSMAKAACETGQQQDEDRRYAVKEYAVLGIDVDKPYGFILPEEIGEL